jgi:hypothetical protein
MAVRVSFVSVLTSFKVAPGTTAPFGSVTVPRIVARCVCPEAEEAKSSASKISAAGKDGFTLNSPRRFLRQAKTTNGLGPRFVLTALIMTENAGYVVKKL